MSTPETKSSKTPTEEPVMPEAKRTPVARLRHVIAEWLMLDTVEKKKKTSDELAVDRTEMAATRTLLAADRTLMAWQRTSLSMLAFGFTLYRVLEAFRTAGGVLRTDQTPRNSGLFLITMGIIAIVLGTLNYWATVKDLREQYKGDIRLLRAPFVMAAIMTAAGVFLFVSVFIRLV